MIRLLENGANSDFQDEHGDTPLHLAINQTITKERKDIMWELLARDADPTITNNREQTAIHLAANKKEILGEIFLLLTIKKEPL